MNKKVDKLVHVFFVKLDLSLLKLTYPWQNSTIDILILSVALGVLYKNVLKFSTNNRI